MDNTQILVIGLIIVLLWIYYQQNNSYLPANSTNREITELKNQAQHYQNLYQKRVAKDLEADQTEKIRELEEQLTQLGTKHQKLTEKFNFYADNLKTKESIIKEYKQEIQRITETLGEAEKELYGKDDKIGEKERIINQLKENCRELETKITELEEQLNNKGHFERERERDWSTRLSFSLS